jgi:hypothetical protein
MHFEMNLEKRLLFSSLPVVTTWISISAGHSHFAWDQHVNGVRCLQVRRETNVSGM